MRRRWNTSRATLPLNGPVCPTVLPPGHHRLILLHACTTTCHTHPSEQWTSLSMHLASWTSDNGYRAISATRIPVLDAQCVLQAASTTRGRAIYRREHAPRLHSRSRCQCTLSCTSRDIYIPKMMSRKPHPIALIHAQSHSSRVIESPRSHTC
ncbi:hypothetical protein C8Q72DRAFT_4862 [Fomitopsis betulina]|nr:hypothetical protein C8Q72DRAFT_4862 [Fomitopsis betulina]